MPVFASIVYTLGVGDGSNWSVVATGFFCTIATGTVMVSPGMRKIVSSNGVSSSGRETSTSAALVAPEPVASTTAVPLDLPATLPLASTVATTVRRIDHVSAPGG